MSFLRRIFGRDVKTDTAVQNGYTLVADDTKTSGLDWSDVLIRGGLGRDLSTGLNNINASGYNIDQVGTPGEYFFGPDTAGSKPSTWGLLKVWREHIGVLYQIVQSADKASNRMFSRYYGAGSWGPWTEYANTSSIPSLSGYATETYVNNSIRHVSVEQTVIEGPAAGSGATQHTYTIGAWDLSVQLRLISPGGGGGGGGGTANNGNEDYGAVGGAGGSSGSVVAMSLTGFPPGTLIQVELGAAGSGGTRGLNTPPGGPGGTPGGAGGNGQNCTIKVQQPGIAQYVLDVTIPGGKGGPGGAVGGINSCSNTPASSVPGDVVININRNLVHISTHIGAAGSGVICGGGGGGISGGAGGILSILSSGVYNVPASGGAGGGGDGQPGASGEVVYASPFNFGKGGGGGGGASRGANFGGAGGAGGSGGLFITVTKLVL